MFCLFFTIFYFLIVDGFNMFEKDLIRDLLKNYDKRVKPDLNVTVYNRMVIYNLVDVDELHETVKLLLWSTQRWKDSSLSWIPKEYHGLENVNLPAMELWLPDWHIFNLVDSSDSVPLEKMNARVTFDGTVLVDFYKVSFLGEEKRGKSRGKMLKL